MSIAEDYIQDDEDSDQSQDDLLLSSSDDQDQGFDLDAFSSLLTDKDEISTMAENPLSKDMNDVSALEELEAMYSGSDDVTADEAESPLDDTADDIPDNVSVLHEIEAMYGSVDESANDETEVFSSIEQSIKENPSAGDTVLLELEALLGSTVDSVTSSATHEVEILPETSSQSAEQFSSENETGDVSALDELKSFLEETSSHEADEADSPYASNDEYLIETRQSILDEVQNLLQSCLDELKAVADGKPGASLFSTGVEYPTRDELKNLLEAILRQLMMISASPETFDLSKGDAVLDELNALLYGSANDADPDTDITGSDSLAAEADGSAVAENLYTAEDIAQYMSSTQSIIESTSGDEAASMDSIADEFEGLLSTTGETADAEIDVARDNSSVLDELEAYLTDASELQSSELQDVDTEYSATETTSIVDSMTSGETASVDSVIDEFESLLAATTETTDSTQEPGVLTAYDHADKTNIEIDAEVDTDIDSSRTALDELETFLGDASELQDAESKTEIDDSSALDDLESYLSDLSEQQNSELQHVDAESSVKETETESISAVSDSTSDVLEQLQTMLDEAVGLGKDESNKDENLVEDEFDVQQEPSKQFVGSEKEDEKDEYTAELKSRQQSAVDIQTDKRIPGSSVKQIDSSTETENNKRLPWVAMSLFVLTAAGLMVLWNLSDNEENLKDRLQLKQKKYAEKPIVVKTETKALTQIKAEPPVSALPAILDNVGEAMVTPASSGFESQSLYENETGGLYGNEAYDSYVSEPESLYDNEAYDSYETSEIPETPTQSYIDETISSESISSNVEMNASAIEPPEVSDKVTDNRLIESLNQQIKQVQYRTENSIALLEESIGLLNERMSQAESTISELQFSLEKHEHHEPVQAAYPGASKVYDDYQIKQSQHKNEESIGLLSNRLIEAELTITKLQFAIDKAAQIKPVQAALKESDANQIKQVQHKNKENISLLSERLIEAESSILKLQSAIEKAEQLESEPSTLAVAAKVNNEHKIKPVQHNNEENTGLLNERVIETESSISKLQLVPVQSVSSIAAKMNAEYSSKAAKGNAKEQTYNIWSVHLLSYYGKPPPAKELKFLDVATVPYEIEKANVKGGIWYRVLVNNSSEYRAAKKYAKMLKKRLGIKKIWISRKQYRYE